MKYSSVTTDDIAKVLKISRGTVSRALNGNKNINEVTKQKILMIAEEMGYKPNEAARSLVMKKNYMIGIVVFSEPQYFWKQLKQGIARAEKELFDYRVTIEYIETDIRKPETQIEAIQELIAKGADAIAISPNDPEKMVGIIDEVTKKGIPILTVSSDVPNSTRTSFVGINETKAGGLAAELLGKMLNGKGKIALITFASSILSIQQRITGFRGVIGNYPDIEVLGPYKLSRTGEFVYDYIMKILEEEPYLDGIYVSYGKLELVAKAVKDSGRSDKIRIVGYDLSEEIASLIKENVIDAVICQEPFNQGYYSVKILYNYIALNRKPFLGIINTKLEAVFKENLNYYMHQEIYDNLL
jgi:LacI family transcriptional regulator